MRELDRLNKVFEFSLYALLLLPFLTIAFGGAVPPAMGVLFAAALPASWWFHRRGLAHAGQARWWNAIVVLFLLVTAWQLVLTELSALEGGIRFVLVLIVIKLFSRLSERDELQLFALSFLGLAAATTVNEDLTFGLLFAVYVVLGTFTLAVFHLRSELTARPRLALRGEQPSLNRGYIAVLVGMASLILAASLSIFFVFPRIGLGFFAPQERSGVSVTGFSDNVELGGHGAIRDNPEVVMRVEFLDGPPSNTSSFYWRTLSFDEYDGRRWARTLPERGRALRLDDGVSDLSRVHRSAGPGDRLQIYLEPLGKDVLPVIRPSHSVRIGVTQYVLKWGPRAGYVRRDWYDDLHHTIDSAVGIAYILTLSTGFDEDEEPPSREPSREFLQLPELTPRVRNLAAQMTRGATTNGEKAEAITNALRSQYTYTTDLPAVGDDPVDAFLFETRRGHCEYFATATVLLLRESGVPTRLVNGFLGGKWNDVGGYLAVRQGDAHSWAEYWDPVRGWLQIDATPASDQLPTNSALEAGRAMWDTMRLRWMKWVIEYDLNAQIEVFRNIAAVLQPRGLMAGQERDEDAAVEAPDPADWRRALLIGGLATLLFFAYRRTRRRLRRHDATWRTTATAVTFVGTGTAWSGWFAGTDPQQLALGGGVVALGVVAALVRHSRTHEASVADVFELIERHAAKVGVKREADEGPSTFLLRLADLQPDQRDAIERFRRRYLAARFGAAVDPEEADRLRAAAHRITERLRSN